MATGGDGWRRVGTGGDGWGRVVTGGDGWRRVATGGDGWGWTAVDEMTSILFYCVSRLACRVPRASRLALRAALCATLDI